MEAWIFRGGEKGTLSGRGKRKKKHAKSAGDIESSRCTQVQQNK